MSLSVAIATFNEEKNLPECLKSVKGLADEIIVVDGSSKDKTVEIAKNFGSKVKITTNKQIFHINKQIAIDMCLKDWILQLDADERVSQELRREISKVINSKPKENGFWIPRKNSFLGRFLLKGGQYPDYTVRLYKNGKGRLPQKDVHEQAVVEGEIGYLKHSLLHYPYEDIFSYLKKWNRYNEILKNQIKENLKDKNFFYFLSSMVNCLFIKPIFWFALTYVRHKGFMDSWQGFIFSFFSSLRFPVSFIKYLFL